MRDIRTSPVTGPLEELRTRLWTSKFTLRKDVASSNLGKPVTQSGQVTRCGFNFGIFWRTGFNEWMASAKDSVFSASRTTP